MKIPHSIIGICCAVVLSACGSGGGGGDAAAVAPAQAFPLQGAFSALWANGMDSDFTVSGTCSGTVTVKLNPANVAATFENVAGFSAVRTQTAVTNCNLAAAEATLFYDSNFAPLGYNNGPGLGYGVFLSPQSIPSPATMPATGKVNDVGKLGTRTNYNDSSKTAVVGRTEASYAIDADTASSVIVNVIEQNFNASNTPLSTDITRYQIGTSGPAVLISAASQSAAGGPPQTLVKIR